MGWWTGSLWLSRGRLKVGRILSFADLVGSLVGSFCAVQENKKISRVIWYKRTEDHEILLLVKKYRPFFVAVVGWSNDTKTIKLTFVRFCYMSLRFLVIFYTLFFYFWVCYRKMCWSNNWKNQKAIRNIPQGRWLNKRLTNIRCIIWHYCDGLLYKCFKFWMI